MKRIYLLLLLPVFIFSCIEDDEDLNRERIRGSWVNETEYENQTLESTFIFQPNGTFENISKRIQGDGDFQTGILSVSTGNYSFEDGELILRTNTISNAEEWENPPATREELIESDNVSSIPDRAKISFEENNSVMILLFYQCNDTHTGGFSNCAPPTPARYDRIEA